MSVETHWEKIYREKAPDAVSWYRPHLETSLALIEKAAPERSVSIIDIGGGESRWWTTFLPGDIRTSRSSMLPKPRSM
jgi:hypothetical protein